MNQKRYFKNCIKRFYYYWRVGGWFVTVLNQDKFVSPKND